MATQTAPASFPYAPTEYSPRPDMPASPPQPRVLWPWPVFLLGAAALCAMALGRNHIRPTTGDRLKRDLNEMRRLVDQNLSIDLFGFRQPASPMRRHRLREE